MNTTNELRAIPQTFFELFL